MARYTRTQGQAVPPGRHRPLPEERASVARLASASSTPSPASTAASRAAHVRLRHAAAREAEGPAHVRRARAPVPPLLRRGRAPQGQHRREPAAAARVAPGQRRLPHGLRLDARRGAPAGRRTGRSRSTARSSTSLRAWSRPATSSRCAKRPRRSCASSRCAQARREDRLPDWVEVDVKKMAGHVQGGAGPLRIRRRTSTKA